MIGRMMKTKSGNNEKSGAIGERQTPKRADEAVTWPSPLLTVNEAAGYLRISRPMLYRVLRGKRLRRLKIRGRTLFDKKDLDRFIEDSKDKEP